MVGATSAVSSAIILLLLAAFVVCLWAIVDAALRPRVAFEAAGQNKVLWIVLPIVGLFLGVIGGVLGIVYLGVIRPKVKSAQSGYH